MIQVNYEKGHCYLILDRRYFHQLFLKHIKIYFYTQGRIYGGEAGRKKKLPHGLTPLVIVKIVRLADKISNKQVTKQFE